MKLRDLKGQRFNRYLVQSFVGRRGHHSMWACRCDCGQERVVQSSNLITGNSTSCGCHKIAVLHKHGKSGGNNIKSRAYISWNMLRDRCKNPNNPEYHNYGGRGLTVCSDWDDFTVFYKDMGERPVGMSIHRVNNDLGYFKGNCVWADDKTQATNRRSDGPKLRQPKCSLQLTLINA